MHLGIESGNPETIKGIRKMINHDDVERACVLLKKYGIKIWGLFMYFNIWEKDGELCLEDYEKSLNTMEYAKKLYKKGLIDYFGGSICTPVPGSELWDIAEKYNLIKTEYKGNWDKWFYKKDLSLVSVYPGIKEKDIFKMHQKTIKSTVLSLIKGQIVDVKNIPFMIRRFFYAVMRQLKLSFWKK